MLLPSPLLTAAAALLVALPAMAADRFVSPRGSDAGNDCGVSASPCATLGHAILQAGPGDTLKVTAGSLFEPIGLYSSVSVSISGGWRSDFGAQTSRTALRERVAIFANTGELIDVRFERIDFLRSGIEIGAVSGQIRAMFADCRIVGRGFANDFWGLEASIRGDAVVDIGIEDTVFKALRGGIKGTGTVYNAGAAKIGASDTAVVTVTMSRSTVSSNRSYYRGGGLGFYTSDSASLAVAITDSEISRNTGGTDTAVIDTAGSGNLTLDLRRVLVSGNKLDNAGILSVRTSGQADVTIDDCRFEKNKGENGAGVRVLAADGAELNLDVRNSVFVRNTAKTWDILRERGAAVYAIGDGGAVHATLTNVAISRNRGSDGAVFAASDTGGSVDLVLRNSVVWGNQTGADLSTLVEGGAVTVDLDHNDIGSQAHMGATVNDLGGNVALDPRFVKPGIDVHLAADSPLIDAGTCTGAPPDDFDGDPRPTGAGCDIGADEFVP